MVWPFNSPQNAPAKEDPYRSLDPSLRKFLEKESPLKYHAESPQAPADATLSESASESTSEKAPTPSSDPSASTPAHHNQSLFSDGRYDHLWRTYRPKTVIEAEGKSDQEKLTDVLQAYKQRRSSISKAAVENCAAVRWEQQECIMHGTWTQRMQMCRYETRALERCFRANVRLLKALGYLSAHERPPDEEERIQMHADKLYQRLQEQERLVAEAQREGREPPVFAPVLPPEERVRAPENAGARPLAERLSKKGREHLEKRVQGQTPEERYYEERAMEAEVDAALQTSDQLEKRMEEVRKDKQERRKRGEGGLGDWISGLFGW